MKKLNLIALCATLCLGAIAQDEIRHPSFASPFSNHAVIQREMKSSLWGKATANSKILVEVISAAGKVDEIETTASENGRWETTTPRKYPAGGPYTIRLTDLRCKLSTEITDVYFGDVWICSGQSNMEMSYSWGLTRGKELMETNSCETIRMLVVPNKTSVIPLDSFTAEWKLCTPENAKQFSAVGYFFGVSLNEYLNGEVPLGLVDSTWSGTNIETWLSAEFISKIEGQEWVAKNLEKREAYVKTFHDGSWKQILQDWIEANSFENAFGVEGVEKLDARYDFSSWPTSTLPASLETLIDKEFDGHACFMRSFELSKELVENATKVTLHLGQIDDDEVTVVNGKVVGKTNGWRQERNYTIEKPAEVFVEGANTIAICMTDGGGGGGFHDVAADDICLKLYNGSKVVTIPLAEKEWSYKASKVDYKNRPPDFDNVSPYSYSACYYGMMSPLIPMTVKGAIWYQGCSNVHNPDGYTKFFDAMIKDWRHNFTGGDFPVYVVQLAAFMGTHEEVFDSAWARFRWMQYNLEKNLENVGTIVTIDVGDHADIHPKDKQTVGERLANLAAIKTYRIEGVEDTRPNPEFASSINKKVIVKFSCEALGISGNAKELKGFQLAGADGVYHWAKAEISNASPNIVEVTCEAVATPTKVRYAWDDYPDCNLISKDQGFPCGPFELAIFELAIEIK